VIDVRSLIKNVTSTIAHFLQAHAIFFGETMKVQPLMALLALPIALPLVITSAHAEDVSNGPVITISGLELRLLLRVMLRMLNSRVPTS